MSIWFPDLLDWLRSLAWWQGVLLSLALFAITFVGSIIAVGLILVRLPPDYFLAARDQPVLLSENPLLRWTALILKNLLGLTLVALGVILSLPGVPGQGVLTILIGIMLMNFPGKRRLERWLIRKPSVLRAVNALRLRHGSEPLRIDE